MIVDSSAVLAMLLGDVFDECPGEFATAWPLQS